MPVDYRFKFPLPNGLHARPASHFEAVTSRFRSKITLIHERTCFRANARSVLSMVSADVKYNDPCCIQVDGDDEQPALAAVRRFLDIELPHCDEPLPPVPDGNEVLPLPRSFVATGVNQFVRGRAVCGGVGIGKVVRVESESLPAGLENERSTDPAYEQQRANSAIEAVSQRLRTRIDTARQPQETEVLRAHAAIVRDVELSEMVSSLIKDKRQTAAGAIASACRAFCETLRQSQSAYLRERVLDVQDICLQLLSQLIDLHTAGPDLTGPSVCVAEHLTPGQLLGLNRKHLVGLVLSEGGTTSHTVILARSMSVPTLVGVPLADYIVRDGQHVIVDGELGLMVTGTSSAIVRYYTMEQERLSARRKQLDAFVTVEAKTTDGHAVEIGANIASSEEAAIAFGNGAQGIGLFRTEMLFVDSDTAPSEQEQTQIYTDTLSAAAGKPVIIRLLDIGGDKPARYLDLSKEENPFLGYRGVRLYREFAVMVKAQIRAILRASATGDVRILVPMVSCLEEVREIRQMVKECVDELASQGLMLAALPQLGVMLEIPSLAYMMAELCKDVDFFSIGSNDLAQYLVAADRTNQKVSGLYTWAHPAFLRLLKSLVDDAKQHGKWIGLCGEMGDQPAALPLLIGMGLNEISVTPPRVTAMKSAVSKSRFESCRQVLDEALKCSTRQEVHALLQAADTTAGKQGALLTPELVFTAHCETKHETIKRLCDQLYLAGRTTRPHQVEEAVWRREDTYSTGFGFGFALPHCKTDDLACNSIAVVRLTHPVPWGSLDDNPVDVAILLAIRGQEHSREHMKILARLSRLVMRDEFRELLRSETEPVSLVRFLEKSLGPEMTAS